MIPSLRALFAGFLDFLARVVVIRYEIRKESPGTAARAAERAQRGNP